MSSRAYYRYGEAYVKTRKEYTNNNTTFGTYRATPSKTDPGRRRSSPGAPRRRWAAAALLACAVTMAAGVPAQAGIDAVVFPFATYAQRPGVTTGGPVGKHEGHYGADLFALASYKDWRFLGENMVTDDENDLERLMVGYQFSANTLLWAGRYHSPSHYWDVLYHHAPFLQPSITRPQIEEWEDEGGVVPLHLWGLRLDETITQGHGEWRLHLGAGAAPKMIPQSLEALPAMKPRLFANRVMTVFAASYLPDALNTDEVGLFASTADMPAEVSGVSGVKQALAGGFGNWTLGSRVHAIGSVFAVYDRVEHPSAATQSHTFYSGYLHLDFRLAAKWTPYVRFEGALATSRDPYLALLSHGLAHTALVGGLRYEFTSRQALTLEAARYMLEGNHYSQLMVQWSGMFP